MLAFSAGDVASIALAVFLVLAGLGVAFVCLKLGGTLQRLSAFIKGAQDEVLPVVSKVGTTVDHVNAQLKKVDRMTDSAVDAADSVDTAVRAVSLAVTRPVQIVTGLAAGVTYAAADFKTKRDWRHAVQAGKEAAARREREPVEELHDAGDEPRP